MSAMRQACYRSFQPMNKIVGILMEHTVKKNNQALLHVGRQSDLALFLKPAICHFKSNYL